MTFNITNLIGTGTDAELLEFARAAIAQILVSGQAYTKDNRTLTRADLAQLRETVAWLEARIAADASQSTTVYATLRRPG